MKVNEVIKEYHASRAFRDLSDSSKRQYEGALLRANELFGTKDIAKIRRSDLLKITEAMSATPAMANRFTRVVSVLFSFALDHDYVQGNPASRLKKHKIGTWSKWYPVEVAAIIALNDRVVSTAVALAWYTGQRESDVLAMKWSDIKGDYISVKVQKTGKNREPSMIEIHPALKEYLGRLFPSGKYICFPGEPMSNSAFRAAFRRIIQRVGISKTFHGIRKGVGAFLAESGASSHEIKAFLNHRTLRMTELYTEEANTTKLISGAVRTMVSLAP